MAMMYIAPVLTMTQSSDRSANALTPISPVPAVARSQPRKYTYVLVHGAWFGGWVWKMVASRLREFGHTVYTPSLTGLGDRRHLLRPGINLDTHADDIVQLFEMEDLQEVVLVGWSYGGMVTTDVLARIPHRISSMVYLDAFAPAPGKAAADYTTRHTPASLALLAKRGEDIPPISAETLGITDSGLKLHLAERLSPHPVLSFLQPSKALPQRPCIPHTYVLAQAYLSRSNTFSAFHKEFAKDGRARTFILDVGHAMMLTHVEETLAVLLDAANAALDPGGASVRLPSLASGT